VFLMQGASVKAFYSLPAVVYVMPCNGYPDNDKNKTQLVRAITWQRNSRLSSLTVWFMWPVLVGHLEHGSKLSTRKTRTSSIWRDCMETKTYEQDSNVKEWIYSCENEPQRTSKPK